MLVLFDIDATLLRTDGAGIRAMLAAARELFPGRDFSFDGIEVSGRLDSIIWRELMERHGVTPDESFHPAFRHLYGVHLERGFDATCRSKALPGARELVDAMRALPGMDLGLVTGNYAHTGMLKVARAGFAPESFAFNAWADDGLHRRDLPRVAMDRHGAATGTPTDPSRVVVIGDTPHDIDCAHHNGCIAVAVATGIHPEAELAQHRPDKLVRDLSDWRSVLAWVAAL